jgi:hypothetical protein
MLSLACTIAFLLAPAAAPQGPVDPCTLLEQVLVPSDPVDAPYNGVGALVGDTLMVSSTLGDGSAPDSGTVLEFQRSGGVWSFVTQIDSPDGAFQDYFGGAMALVGDTLVVGSLADGGPGYQSGAVYVFQRFGGAWAFSQKLIGSGVGAGDWFGAALDMEGDRLAIGCTREHTGSQTGTVYLFERQAGVWSEVQKLVPDVFPAHEFGSSLDLDGDQLVVGSPQFNLVSDSGNVYVYAHVGSNWVKSGLLAAPDAVNGNAFGADVALQGDRLVVGAPRDSPWGVEWAGSAYALTRSGSTWTFKDKLTATALEAHSGFGKSLALQGDWLIVGQGGDYLGGSAPAGAHVFHHDGNVWAYQARLDGAEGTPGAAGDTVAIDGTTIVQTAPAVPFGGKVQVHTLPPGPIHAYCTAKVNSQGCLPSIGFLGSPSASADCPFWILAQDVLNQKLAILFYGTSGAAVLPFGGGFLCVQAPLTRAWPLPSGGNPPPANDCSGSLAFDFQSWLFGPFGAGLTAGTTVYAQFWYRDPVSAGTVGLTDALQFTLWP